MAPNPLIRKNPPVLPTNTLHKSAGILDDHAVRKNIATKEGTIEHTPIDPNHIVNKNYVDTTTTANPLYVAVAGDTMTGNLLVDDQAGGNELGPLLHAAPGNATPAYSFGWDTNTGMTSSQGDRIDLILGGSKEFQLSTGFLQVGFPGTNLTPAFGFLNDGNCGMWNPDSDVLAFSAGNIEFLRLTEAAQDELVVNEQGVDIDFRVESSTLTNALFVSGETGATSIGGTLAITGITMASDHILFDSFDHSLQWVNSTHNISMSSGGALTIENSDGGAKLSLRNDQAVTAQVFSFLGGQSDHLSLIPGAGYDYYMFENSTSGENKVVRQYGYITNGANKRAIQWQVDDTDDFFHLTKEAQIKGFAIDMPVEMTDDLIFVGAGTGLPYGEVFVNDNSTVTSVINSGFTQFLHFDTNGHSNLSTPDHTNDHITIVKAGVYMADCCVNIKNSSGAAHVVEVVIAKNNGTTIFPNMRRHRTLGTGTDVGAIPICGHLDLAVDDTIEVWITSDSASARDITGEDVVLMLTMVGGT